MYNVKLSSLYWHCAYMQLPEMQLNVVSEPMHYLRYEKHIIWYKDFLHLMTPKFYRLSALGGQVQS